MQDVCLYAYMCICVCKCLCDMNHSEGPVLLEGRRNRGDRSDELHFGTIFLAAPHVILSCVSVCERRGEKERRCMHTCVRE